MFSRWKKAFLGQEHKSLKATINAETISIASKETVLQAALRQGIDFPYSCRVGGCATCKCKLLEGKVRELTETGYILSDDELNQGFILACQSVPLTDIRVEVAMNNAAQKRTLKGRVIAQEKMTHDITRLCIQLDDTLQYKAGQFAEISIEALPHVTRSYSFAAPSTPDSQISFFVRKVPGGAFSTFINEQAVIGQRVTVNGPMGDFWLRSANTPLLLIAGGSGLAPIFALLQEAAQRHVNRPVTLLFGAREQRDLYALQEIQDIAAAWPTEFRFIPVLSQENPQSDWKGERGWLNEKIPAYVQPDAHAYLCGPPAMIDSAIPALIAAGLSRENLHADRFTTQQDIAAVA